MLRPHVVALLALLAFPALADELPFQSSQGAWRFLLRADDGVAQEQFVSETIPYAARHVAFKAIGGRRSPPEAPGVV